MGGKFAPGKTVPIAKREELYRRKMRAAELRRTGHTWEEIGAELEMSKANAYYSVQSLLKEHQSLAYDEIALYRQESLDRLMGLLKVQWERAMIGDDKATTQCRLLISQIGDLTGEKAPVKVEIGESDVDRALRELAAEIDRRSAGAAGEAAGVQAAAGDAD